MKVQDLLFFIIAGILIISRKPRLLVSAGLFCLVLAIPLFARWIFFTAERLTWYAAGFFFVFTLFSLLKPHKVQ